MKLWVSICVVSAVLLSVGCRNRANMEPGSAIRVTDDFGNKYIIRHELFEVYRVVVLPK